MEWTEILNWIFGGTSILGALGTIVFWSKTKRAKEAETVTAESSAKQSVSEAEQADIATQIQKIDLGNKYMEDTLKTMELVKQALARGEGNQNEMLGQLNILMDLVHKLSDQTDKQEQLLQLIVKYLNGDFQAFVEELKEQGLLDKDFMLRRRQKPDDTTEENE